MAGLSGGGWSTTFAAAIDKRISASFPIAGSVPCAMRNPTGLFPGQNWTGSDAEDYEQNCAPSGQHPGSGRPAFSACNYTCQYLLAGLEPSRFQVQILHEYDTCCFSPHDRHQQMMSYEANVRAELQADDRSTNRRHGWFTSTADNHSKHEVADQDKTIIAAALAQQRAPGAMEWNMLPCDILHQPLPANCSQNRDPGLPPGYIPPVPENFPGEPDSEPGYVGVGWGACRDSHGKYGPWGQLALGNSACAVRCSADAGCVAYMSTSHRGYCQLFCLAKSALCGRPGDGGNTSDYTSTVKHDVKGRFCWRKDSH